MHRGWEWVLVLFHYPLWTDIGTCQWQVADKTKMDHQQPEMHVDNIIVAAQPSRALRFLQWTEI
jgi:hypothetical protein